MLKLIRTKLNKKQIDFVNENKAIINKRSHDIPQELEHNSYLNRGDIEDTNKIASTITKNSQIYTPFVINPKNSQLENQKYQQEYLKQNIQESQSLTILKRHSRSKSSSDEDRQSEKNSKLFVAIRKKLSEKEIIEEIQKCLNNGANINAQNAGVKTVLHIAIEKDYKYVVEFLLKQKDIKTDIPNKDGKIALDLARHLNKQDIVQILENYNQPGSSNQINQAKRQKTDSVEDRSSKKRKKPDQDEEGLPPAKSPKQEGTEQVVDYTESESSPSSLTGYENQQEDGVSPENNPTDVSNASNSYSSHIGLKNILHGIIYQLKLLMLFVRIGVTNNYQFRLATEMDKAKKFDDLVFECENVKEDEKSHFLQAKHKQDESEKIKVADLLSDKKNDDFGLQKYFISFRNINKNPEFNKDKLKYFILCTNINFDHNDLGEAKINTEEITEEDVFSPSGKLKQN